MPVAHVTGCRVFDLQRFSIHDGPGIRTTVFLRGCPLRCAWCQNPEAFHGACAEELTPQAIIAEVLKDHDYYTASGGGLTVSGGEPLANVTAVHALLAEAKRHGLHTCAQTSGAVPQENIAAVLELIDLCQFDLKHMDSSRHRELTGAGTERIHQNATFLVERGATVQFRMPLIPRVNDDPENLDRLAHFLLEHGVSTLRLVPYHRLHLDKYRALGIEPGLKDIEPPTPAVIEGVVRFMNGRGIAVELDG